MAGTQSLRYLLRLENKDHYSPNDVQIVAERTRNTLGSAGSASHFRVGSVAIEFNLFAKDEADLADKSTLLAKAGFKIITSKRLDAPILITNKDGMFAEGLSFFDEERFWEAHEALEQLWRTAEGEERDVIQSLILTCAAFVHYQKGETDIGLSILRRARAKMQLELKTLPFDMENLRSNVDSILSTGKVRLFKLRKIEVHPLRKRTTSAATKMVRARPPARSTPGSE